MQPTSPPTAANLTQVGGVHYKVGYQHWDFVAQGGLGYFEGQITKYVSRARKKNGLQDVQKAGHFLDKLLELTQQGYRPTNLFVTAGMITRFCDANDLDDQERLVVRLVSFWRHADSLISARALAADIERGYLPVEGSGPAAKSAAHALTPDQLRAVDDTANLSDTECGEAS